MNMQQPDKRKKMERLGAALSLSEKRLKTNPYLGDEFLMVQTLLHTLHFQTEWQTAGPLARLLIGFRVALHSQGKAESQTGFMGPHLTQLQIEIERLLKLALKPAEYPALPLLAPFFQIVMMGTIYLATQSLGNWKNLFPEQEKGELKKAGFLLRDLGIIYLLSSRLIEQAFIQVAEGLMLDKKSQKRVAEIGMSFIFMILIIADDQDNSNQEDFLETLSPFMQPSLQSLAELLHEIGETADSQAEHLLGAAAEVEQLLEALNRSDYLLFKEIIIHSLDHLEFPYGEVKEEIKTIIQFCDQLNNNLKNVFFNTKMGSTSLSQVA